MEIRVETEYRISDAEFELLRSLIKELTGINLSDQKKMLVVSRLSKRLRSLGLTSFAGYYKYVTEDIKGCEEIDHLINRMTTNKTDFYRESHHFDFMQKTALPHIYGEGRKHSELNLRVWSAGCSSGEEPYTIAITLKEFFQNKPGWDVKILATDLDTEMLDKSKAGIYKQEIVSPISNEYLRTYFKKGVGENEGLFMAKDTLKGMIVFRRHNLVYDSLPTKRQFDIVFCRNVIIYFDEKTKIKVINQFYNALKEGGYLFLGHSESPVGCESKFKLLGNSLYRKIS
ncbi:MAG: CheR family methyltransferase [Candidatus Aquicultor sp.]